MSDDKSSKKQAEDLRGVDLSDDRKGIIVMPMDAAPIIDITNEAPSGLPAPRETRTASGTPGTPPTPEK
jgi:hypothetical protein